MLYRASGAALVTIAVSEENRAKLLRIARELQKNLGKKVSFDEVISYLVGLYEEKQRRLEFFRLFCEPVEGASFEKAYRELVRARRKEEQLEKRYSLHT